MVFSSEGVAWYSFRMTTLTERFWAKVNKKGPKQGHMKTRCWMWTGCRNRDRTGRLWYGYVSVKRKLKKAHRVAWALKHGQEPKERVLHRCDEPGCVRPSHLFSGSLKQNTQDMIRKGRVRCGSRHPNSRLTEANVREIRSSGLTQRQLASKFGVNQKTIFDALHGRYWRHVA